MTAAQLEQTPPNPEVLLFGIYDRLLAHDRATVNVVLVPADADGQPDWAKADPANVENLPADEWPADPKQASRAAVIVDQIDGCDPETSLLVFLRKDGQPSVEQIAGPPADAEIAMLMIGRDIGAKPPKRKPSALSESLAKLTADLFPPPAANDNKPQAMTAATDGLDFIDPTQWHGKPIPSREWYVEDLIPMRQVTILNGDAGVAKSLLALQIAASGAMAVGAIGIEPAAGRTVYIGAEDEAAEFQRRLADIACANGKDFTDLGDFRLLSLADCDALISVPDSRGNMQATPLFGKIIAFIREFRPRLLVLDTAADLFGGDEIKRGQVRQFIADLRKVAIGLDLAIILLAHPSVQGMQSGTGSSGSTAWNNSVRSRLYLTKGDKDADPDVRILKTMKSNYGKTGDEIRLRWKDGTFVIDDGRPTIGAAIVNNKADRVFRDLLSAINRTGERVAKTRGVNYAPKVMAERPDAEGLSVKLLEGAMQRLMAAGELKVVMEGPPTKLRQRLVLASEFFGAREG